MKRFLLIFCVAVLCGCSQLSLPEKQIYHVANEYYFAPHLLPNVLPEMQFAAYWIDRCACPDSLILSAKQIDSLNAAICRNGLTRNIEEVPGNDSLLTFYNAMAWKYIERKRNYICEAELYQEDGSRLLRDETEFYLKNLPQDSLEFVSLCLDSLALLTHFTDEKMLPGEPFLSVQPLDTEFNQMQNNGLDMGNLTFAICYSRDKNWVFQINATSMGWMPRQNFFMLNSTDFISHWQTGIIRIPYSQYWRQADKNDFAGVLRMGTNVWIDTTFTDQNLYKILCPQSSHLDFAYVQKQDVTEKPHRLTSRNLLNDAFLWLNYPYGWGDTDQFVDCSKFIQKLFALYGIQMPRNGDAQGFSWQNLKDIFPELSHRSIIDKNGIPGFTLLRMPGHIMLYIGNQEGREYAIHVLYRYLQIDGEIVTSRVPNRVVVSDIELGEGTQRGSYLNRLSHIINPGIVTK
ncbi:MAG TPA: NlpC/P60 family protein [Candidatus Cloacimonadota bacterium]|nr:NlpC/P60 family protein [Candidatus Cloacimonadota bacterium]